MRTPSPLPRRRLLAGLLCWPAIRAVPTSAQEGVPVLVVSRQKVLQNTEAGKTLREAETRLTDALEERIAAAKQALEEQESELARLRGKLSPDAFRERTAAFDRRVRTTRREAQRQAARLQKLFRTKRKSLARSLAPILIEVLKEHGSDIVVDADSILVARPGVDITDEVIARFDATVPPPEFDIGDPAPILPDEASGDGG